MIKFLSGLLIGIFLTIILKFTLYTDPKFCIKLGRLLDHDIVYLKNGAIIKGAIFKESNEETFVEIEKGYIKLSPSDLEHVEKDYLLRYIKELI